MARRIFHSWFETFTDTVADWNYYVDFTKVFNNMNDLYLRTNLNILNTLVGSKQIREDFIAICEKYPDVLTIIPILLAIRLESKGRGKNRKPIALPIREYGDDAIISYDFDFYSPNYTIENYADLLENTGVFELLQSHLVKNLQDYVYGVEVGLDSNGRKNRMGKIMEALVERELWNAGLKEKTDYYKQISTKQIEALFHIDLSAITNNGKNHKKFDFAIHVNGQLYLTEVNFYSKSGSKPNETTRSYENLAEKLTEISNVHFVWITDGEGWQRSKSNLEEAFERIPRLYNLHDIRNKNIKELLEMEMD